MNTKKHSYEYEILLNYFDLLQVTYNYYLLGTKEKVDFHLLLISENEFK